MIFGLINKNKAFTLAELLLTLTIVGVIASYTIPSLLQNIQDSHYRAGLKRSYSILSQTMTRILSDNGGNISGAFTNAIQTRNGFTNYLNTAKVCDTGVGICWPSTMFDLNGNELVSSWALTPYPSIMLSNGMLVEFNDAAMSSSCTSNWMAEAKSNIICSVIFVDVNGFKSPNTLGKDIYMFWILKDRILPVGSGIDNWSAPSTICTAGGDVGRGCAAKYIKGT